MEVMDVMDRRQFARAVGTGVGLAALAAHAGSVPAAAQAPAPLTIAMLVHPDMVLLDLAGPQTVFSLSMATVHLVWKDRQPVRTDVGVSVQPTTTFADCPESLDVLFVPGGLKGSVAAMEDREVLDFLASRGARPRYVTSVCTGGLVLGAAGLLRGYRATARSTRGASSSSSSTIRSRRCAPARRRRRARPSPTTSAGGGRR
jgi:cyclohexyl-isocyanide hydratase